LGNGGEEMMDDELLQILGDQIYNSSSSTSSSSSNIDVNESLENLSESLEENSVMSRLHQQFWNQQLLESSDPKISQDSSTFDLSCFVMDDSEIGMVGNFEIESQSVVNGNIFQQTPISL